MIENEWQIISWNVFLIAKLLFLLAVGRKLSKHWMTRSFRLVLSYLLLMSREQAFILSCDKHALELASIIKLKWWCVQVPLELKPIRVKVIAYSLLKKLYLSLQLSNSLPTTRSRRYLIYFTPFVEQHINHVLQT